MLNKKRELRNNKNVKNYECLLKRMFIVQVMGKNCYLR